MAGTISFLGGWQQSGSIAGSTQIDFGDVVSASFSSACLLVFVVTVAGNGSGAPVLSNVHVGTDTTLSPAGSVGAWTQQLQSSISSGSGVTVGVWTADASSAFSGLDVAFQQDRSSQQYNIALYAVVGATETFTTNVANNTSGTSSAPSVTATSLTGDCIQIGVAQGVGSAAAPVAGNGFTTDSANGSAGTVGPSAIGHKVNTAGASPNTFSLTSSYIDWIAGIVSFPSPGVVTTAREPVVVWML